MPSPPAPRCHNFLLPARPAACCRPFLPKACTAAVALMVDNIEIALDTLRAKGFHAINEDELKET